MFVYEQCSRRQTSIVRIHTLFHVYKQLPFTSMYYFHVYENLESSDEAAVVKSSRNERTSSAVSSELKMAGSAPRRRQEESAANEENEKRGGTTNFRTRWKKKPSRYAN